MLASAAELRHVGEASSGAEALRAVDALKPDLVVMDVQMPVMDGAATAKALLSKHPDLRIVAWTVSEDSDDLLRMSQAGCSGYVLKDVGPAEFERALLAAMRSEGSIPRKMIPDVLRRAAETARPHNTVKLRLTPREMDVLRRVAKGHTTKRIALDLGLKAPSVETHLHSIFKKLEATNRGETVSTALKLGLITLADL